MTLAETTTSYQYLISCMEAAISGPCNNTGDIDAGYQRELAEDFSLTGDGQGVFIIYAGVARPDNDLTGGKVTDREGFETWLGAITNFIYPQSTKGLHNYFSAAGSSLSSGSQVSFPSKSNGNRTSLLPRLILPLRR